MRKFHIKINKFWLAVCILILIIASFTAAINITLSSSKTKFILQIENYFGRKITIGRVIYLPPNFIILKDVSLRPIFIPTIFAKLSLREIITKRKVSVSDIYVLEPGVNSREFRYFIKDNFKQIMALINSLPGQDLSLFIKKAGLDLTEENIGIKSAAADLTLIKKGNSLAILGSINEKINYNFQALLSKGGISLEKFELNGGDFRSQLSGSFNGGDFGFKGFVFMPKANLFVLDIDCRGNFKSPELKIEHLNFSLNNNPVSLKGDILLLNPLTLDLGISSYLMYLKYGQAQDIKKVELKIKGAFKDNLFSSAGSFKLDSVKKREGGTPLEKLEFGFDRLNLYFSGFPRLKMYLGQGSLFLQTKQNEYNLSLKGLNAIFYLQDKKIKFVKFSSLFYDGSLNGQGYLDLSKSPPVITSMVRIRDASSDKLEGLLAHLAKFHGKLDSQMYFSSFPKLFLKGDMFIEKGHLYNLEFFKWLADFFDLPALKNIYFNRVSSNFLVNEEGAGLEGMYLESKDVNLNGSFKLGHNDLVSSKISLAFTKQLLQESAKFTPLIKLLGKDFKNPVFDFQLSGNLHKMNFQWLQSDFKRRIQASIPHFIEARIDRNLEKIIGSFSSK